ncbi:MAG: M48 family metallopeptidase [Betaproteobacteria bacterium]|nr:M48 family metallopeptidase [Betaproteobacteria bacterium]
MSTAALALTVVFALFVAADACVKLWLAARQVRHVSQHRAQVPAAFAGRITLDAHQKAADYTAAKAQFSIVGVLVGTVLLLGFTFLGGLDALNRALVALLGPGMLQQIALVVAFMAISALLDLPLNWYAQFRLEARFGFNRMDMRTYVLDMLKGALLSLVLVVPLAFVVLWLMGRAGSLWWLYAWGVWAAFALTMMVVYPTFIAPLFNKFSPLDDAPLKARVEALMARTGFAAKGLFVMDGSRRSAHANAYFTGLGKSKRVVFFDTLLAKLSGGEVEAVLAHELGHFKHRHVTRRLVWMMGASLAGLALLGWLSSQVWFYIGLGVQPNLQGPNDALALLLFMLVVPVFLFAFAPLGAYLSRRQEFEADAFAVRHASGSDLAAALVKLYEDNASTLTPDPLYVRWYYTHPPASQRLERLGQGAAP